jgi:glyoxylase-like metal-dependent hydrolase (beta-lactamase superfamily II)
MTRYQPVLLRAGEFRLDGGSMFGLIPRSVWSRQVQTDDKGRITVSHNALLLRRIDEPGAVTTGPRLIVLEVGTGDKLDDASRDLFAMDKRSITDALTEAGVNAADVGGVIVSHLHFDHAGGLTRLPRAGETPEWTGPASAFSGSRGTHGVVRTFPGARVITQEREWDDALKNRSVMTRTYFADHLEPIRSQVKLVNSPKPFPIGVIPDRDADPALPQEVRETEVFPGVFVFLTPGHTWGQQATRFVDAHGRSIVFVPDVLPTLAHLGQAYSLAYDVEPYTSMVTRRWLLREAAERGWVLVLDHEPGHPAFTARPNNKGWFDLVPADLS